MENITKGEKTRLKILRTAMELINTKGYSNTSINDIIEATGVKKGNLYFHFSSKEELGIALIQEAKKDYLAYLSNSIKGEHPLEKIDSLLTAVFDLHRKKNFIGGCIFGNIALEMGDLNPDFSQLIQGVFNIWIKFFSKLLHEAQELGDLNKNIQPELMAKHIVAAMEGAVMMAKLSKNENDVLDTIKSIRVLLGFNGEEV